MESDTREVYSLILILIMWTQASLTSLKPCVQEEALHNCACTPSPGSDTHGSNRKTKWNSMSSCVTLFHFLVLFLSEQSAAHVIEALWFNIWVKSAGQEHLCPWWWKHSEMRKINIWTSVVCNSLQTWFLSQTDPSVSSRGSVLIYLM